MPPATSGECAGNAEGDHLAAPGRHAHHLRGAFVVADREKAAAQPRAGDRGGDRERGDRQRQRHQVERRRDRSHSAGTRTALSTTPGPPSSGVLRMIVARTKVTARVSKAKSSSRTSRWRKTTAPSANPNPPATIAAIGSVARNGQFALVVSVAVAYMPAPKKAPWPKEKYPE